MLEHRRLNLNDSLNLNLNDSMSLEELKRYNEDLQRELREEDQQMDMNRVEENGPIQLESVKVEQKSNKPYKEEDRYHYVEMDVGHKVDRLVKFIPGVMGVGGDGYYMAKLKNLIRKDDYMRTETWLAPDQNLDTLETDQLKVQHYMGLPAQDYSAEDIRESNAFSEEELKEIISRQSEIIWTCRKYRLTHLWPWTKRGKERKEDVVAVQKEAEKRYNAARTRLAEMKAAKKLAEVDKTRADKRRERAQDNVFVNFSENTESSFNKANSGFRKFFNTFKAYFVGGIIRNVINTAAMVPAIPFWLLGSIGTSLYHRSWDGAFSLPHAHRPSTWYNYYQNSTFQSLERKRNAPQIQEAKRDLKDKRSILKSAETRLAPLLKRVNEANDKLEAEKKKLLEKQNERFAVQEKEVRTGIDTPEKIERIENEINVISDKISTLKARYNELSNDPEYRARKAAYDQAKLDHNSAKTNLFTLQYPGYNVSSEWHNFFSGPSDKLVHEKEFGYTDPKVYQKDDTVDYNNMQQI